MFTRKKYTCQLMKLQESATNNGVKSAKELFLNRNTSVVVDEISDICSSGSSDNYEPSELSPPSGEDDKYDENEPTVSSNNMGRKITPTKETSE
ncbi:hypothetical protein JTB14_028269 [Gonioctena quinquepunctata]|nr:hypothetical protein JTB14_028269 [Gonioctena quinquepunctata]